MGTKESVLSKLTRIDEKKTEIIALENLIFEELSIDSLSEDQVFEVCNLISSLREGVRTREDVFEALESMGCFSEREQDLSI